MGDLSKNISRKEMACKCGCGFNTCDAELLVVLQRIADYFGKPIKINSGCRCNISNINAKGEPGSKHLWGQAADVVVGDTNADDVAQFLEESYPGKYGIGRYNTWTHIDVRGGQARWDKRG